MNFQITQGTGTTIGSDQVAGINFQEIKLIDATVGSATPVGTNANPLRVSLEFTGTNTNPLTVTGDITPNPPSDRLTTGTMAAAIDQVIVDCTGVSTLGWTTSGNWIGTMTHEVQFGDGQWFIVETIDTNLANDGKPFIVTQWTEGLNNDPWITNVAGATQLRFRFISYVSGSALITTNGTVGINAVRIYNLTPSILQTTAVLNDGFSNAITSTTIGLQQALDVNIAGGVTIDVNLDHTTDNVLVYGNDGIADQKIKTDASGNVSVAQFTSPWVVSGSGNFTVVQPTGTNLHTVVDSGSITVANATLAVTQSGVWSVGRTWALASGTDSILSVQSGAWTTGRTWTLANGTDSVAAVQSGTWNINNISGTVSLPTGAATETTLSTRLADATFTARINTLGQKTMANSTPVVLASDQSVIPVSQSGTWTVQPGNTANTVPWLMTINQGGNAATVTASNALKIDGSAVTQPISAVSLPLPTGASTSANQTNGSQKSQVVDGANATTGPVQAISGTNYLPVVQPSSGTTGSAVAPRTTQVGGSDGTNLRTISTDTTGKVKVDLNDGSGTAITSTVVGATQSVDTNVTQGPDGYAAQQNQVYTTSFDFNLPTGGTETPAVFLKNPNASGKTLVIKRILVSGVSTGNNEAVAYVYADPTTSANGTAATATTTSIGSGATAVATPFSGPTASANGARLFAWQVPSAANNTPAAPSLSVDGLVRVAPNHTLLITGKPAANNMNLAWTIVWQEI